MLRTPSQRRTDGSRPLVMLRRMTNGSLSASSTARAVMSGSVSAREVVEGALGRAERAQADFNAFITIDAAGALAAADAVDGRLARGEPAGPLAGVPVAIKDNIATAGLPNSAASRILEGYVAPFDATVVARLKAAGAVVIAKTNLDEFGMGSTGERSAMGATRNPRDRSRVAGGSSSGSAAAVSAGVVPLALGTDTGGSSRLPAAFCGVVGFKPTYGGVSRYGLLAYASSLDQVGVLAGSVEDVGLALRVMAGSDSKDATSFDLDLGEGGAAGLAGKRFGVVTELAVEGFGTDALSSLELARVALEARGAEVVDVSLPNLGLAVACYYVIAAAEASSNLARYAGMLYGSRVGEEREGQEAVMRRTRGDLFGPEVKRRVLLGSFALSAGYYDAYYGRALKVRHKLAQEMATALSGVDALMTPTAPGVAYHLGEKLADPLAMYLGDVATCLANLAGFPAVSVPCGTGEGGLPLGVQLVAGPGADGALLRLAAALEAALAAGSDLP